MTVSLTLRLALAVVLGVAGQAKSRDRVRFGEAVASFPIPAVLIKAVAIAIPLVEILTAVLLVIPATSRLGGFAATALFSAFSVAIAVNLARGRRPDCRCFGGMHPTPIGPSSLIRNAVLIAVGLAVALPVPAESQHLSQIAVIASGGALALAAQGWTTVKLMQQNGRLLLRVEALEAESAPAAPTAPAAGVPVGLPAPEFTLPGVFGETVTLESLTAIGRPVLLMFVDPSCGPCNAMMPEVGRWQRDNDLTIALISTGARDVNRAKATEHDLSRVLVQQAREVADAYRAAATPAAVLIGRTGAIGSPVVSGAQAIRGLRHQAGSGHGPTPVDIGFPTRFDTDHRHHDIPAPALPFLAVGAAAPDFTLPDLHGRPVRLAEHRGTDVLLLFWDPLCGFCEQMTADLQAWEAQDLPGAPRLIVISTGGPERNRGLGLRTPVLLDERNEVRRSFGVAGTPIAVMIGPDGQIVSEPGIGAPGVFALAGARA